MRRGWLYGVYGVLGGEGKRGVDEQGWMMMGMMMGIEVVY